MNTETVAHAGEELEAEGMTAEQQLAADQAADAEMAAGFEQGRTNETTLETTDNTTNGTEVAAEAASAAEEVAAEVDPWEGVHPTVRKNLEALNKVPDQIRNLAGHIGGLKSSIQAAKDAASTAAAAGKDAPTGAQITAAAESGPKWKQLKEDFPEWAEAAEERFGAMSAGSGPDVDAITTAASRAAVESVTPTVKEAVAEARRLAQVDLAHEGWEETISTAAFGTWLGSQKPEIKDLAASDRPKDAIKLLDSYKEFEKAAAAKAAVQAKSQQRLAGAAPVRGTTTAGPVKLNDDAAFEAGFKSVRMAG